MKRPLRIGITLGDLNGIGPEVALKAVSRRGWPAGVRFVLVGSRAALPPRLPPRTEVWDPRPEFRPRLRPGRIDPDVSAAAALWIRAAAAACQQGDLDAMVTAPICKEGFHRAGLNVPGHTEYLAALTGARRFAMMLFGGPLRVVLATRHLPLAEVPRQLNRRTLTEAIRLTAAALPWLGAPRARIAVCGLNPHAGEGGDLGREEIEIIAPALRALRRAGLNLAGPVPGDVCFHYAARGDFDAVVAMYHDQGLAPLKLLAFDRGVNVTLGLPIVRTSPDHGTAFDIAGQGRANPASMVAAVRWAITLAGRPHPWRKG